MIDKHCAVGYTFFWVGMTIDSSGQYWDRAKERYKKK